MKLTNKTLALIFCVTILASCKKDFEEINKNPNGFTSASDGSLFNAVISTLKSGWNEQLYVNNSVLYKETQQASLAQVRWNNYTIGTEEIWADYYTALPNLRELESRWKSLDTTSHAIQNMMAMEKIVLAYKTFKLTDLFGDIPFSQAGYGYQDVTKLHPAFDSQEYIYKTLLSELEWAANHIDVNANNVEPYLTFKSFDNLFFGDLAKWRKFANSLRLRYAMRMVNREPVLAGTIVQDIIGNFKPVFGVNEFGQLNDDPNESALLYPYQLGYRNESKGWSYNQSKDLRLGTTIWRKFSANDSSDGSGIFDPRAFYFFETNNNNKWAAFPNDNINGLPADGGIPYEYQRDVAYSIKGAGCLYSPVNYYLVRDMDYVPDVLITGAEVIFLRAEAYMRGIGVAQDVPQAGTEFLSGVQFSLDFWQHIMTNSKLPTSGTPFATNITVPPSANYIALQNNLNYFSLSEADQLKMIYEQSWVDFFMQPQQAFALARRTNLTPHVGTPSQVYRFPIPPSEISYNLGHWQSTYGTSGDGLSTRLWWMQ
jgi:hypothetical protein